MYKTLIKNESNVGIYIKLFDRDGNYPQNTGVTEVYIRPEDEYTLEGNGYLEFTNCRTDKIFATKIIESNDTIVVKGEKYSLSIDKCT